jgi:hypothetical protein
MSFSKMVPPYWAHHLLHCQRNRDKPPPMVLHARVGQTVKWLQRTLETKRWSREKRLLVSHQLLRFAQLFLIVGTTLHQLFVDAAYMLDHPGECALEESLTVSYTAVQTYLEAMFTEGFGEQSQDKLEAAARAGDVDAAKRSVMALVNHSDYNGTTALMLASLGGHTEMMSWLLAVGADPIATDVFGETFVSYM